VVHREVEIKERKVSVVGSLENDATAKSLLFKDSGNDLIRCMVSTGNRKISKTIHSAGYAAFHSIPDKKRARSHPQAILEFSLCPLKFPFTY